MSTPQRSEILLGFNGPPVQEGVGNDPNFIGRTIPAFTGLVQSLCEEPDAEPGENETLTALVARMNLNVCTFRMQENDRMTPHGIERFREVIDSFAEEDQDETIEVLNGITDQSFGNLKKFLSALVSAETSFMVEYNGETTEMDDLEQMRDALKLLRGLRKQETKEEGVRVRFAGYLPQQKKAEFTREGSTIIEVARINPRARGLEDLIERIQEDRVVSLVTRQSGEGKPSTTILVVE